MNGEKRKKQVCIRIDDELLKEMEKVKAETGVPLSVQFELSLKGFEIKKKTGK